MDNIISKAKTCSKCKVEKGASEFYKSSRYSDGLYCWCKECFARGAKGYYAKHKEKLNAYSRQWAAENPEKRRETSRKSRLKNLERARASVRKAHAKRSKERVSYAREWQRQNPDKVKARAQRRSERIRNVVGSHSKDEWLKLLAFYNERCLCCGITEDICRDHVVPLFHGGDDYISNIQPLCRPCNAKKHLKTIDYRKVLPAWFQSSC